LRVGVFGGRGWGQLVGVTPDPLAHGIGTQVERSGDAGDGLVFGRQEDDLGALDGAPRGGMSPS